MSIKINAWIFLISSNRKFDYRTVACPDFICRKGASQLLDKIKYSDSEEGSLNCCEIENSEYNFKLTLIYRRKELTKEDLLPEINDTATDRGRPILLTEGIIIKGMRADKIKSNKIVFSEKQFNEVHKRILKCYKDFWVNFDGYGLPYETTCFELNQDKLNQNLLNIVLDSRFENNENNIENNILKNKSIVLRKLKHKIWSFAFNPKDDFCAFRHHDESIRLCKVYIDDLKTKVKEIQRFDVRESPLEHLINYSLLESKNKINKNSIVFSHTGEMIASAVSKSSLNSKEFVVKLWKLKNEATEPISGKPIGKIEIEATEYEFILIAFSPNDDIVAINNHNNITLYKIATQEKTTLAGYKDSIKSIDISKTSPILIAMGDNDGAIKLWNLITRELKQSIPKAHLSSINSVVFSPDGSIFISGSEDKYIKFWNSKTGKLLHTINTESAVNSLAFNPEGTLLASGHDDKTIKLWDMKNKQLINNLTEHQSAVTSVGFGRDSRILIGLSKDLEIIIWNFND